MPPIEARHQGYFALFFATLDVEQSFLAYLRGRCRNLPQVSVGIGDDAAIIAPVDGQQVACTDQIIEGVDFESAALEAAGRSLADVGYKAMAINLSDIAAMGAEANAALVTLTLPRRNATRIAGQVYDGILEAAEQFEVAIAGGDISTYDGPLAISITLLGHVPTGQAWLRSGAEQGDAILVTGAVGGSILGRHLRPQPRLALARALKSHVKVHAAIDISDGFSLDLDRLCAASGVGAELDTEAIPIHADAHQLSQQSGWTPFEHAWRDGEDFELIVTMSPEDAERLSSLTLPTPLTRVGTIVGRTGIWRREGGKFVRLSPQGYEHKAKA